MVRFSYAHIPAYPLDESIRLIKVADELGFYAAYACDETWWKDMWLMFAAAARETRQIRLGPNVTHVILRDPAHIVQMLGTLDAARDAPNAWSARAISPSFPSTVSTSRA